MNDLTPENSDQSVSESFSECTATIWIDYKEDTKKMGESLHVFGRSFFSFYFWFVFEAWFLTKSHVNLLCASLNPGLTFRLSS